MASEEEFAKKARVAGEKLEGVAERVNLIRAKVRDRIQVARELTVRPFVDKLASHGVQRRPLVLGILRGEPMGERPGTEHAPAVELGQKPEAPQAEVLEPIEEKRPTQRPALF